MQNKKQLLKEILSKKETRVYYLQHNFLTFCLYYFSNSFHYPRVAPFHKDWCLAIQEWWNVYIEWFRESAKTMIVWMMYDIWCIVYQKKRFICALSYDWSSAKDYLFKIAIQLQTNEKLINDFWQLFYWDWTQVRKSQRKSIAEFITENDVKLKAFSIWTSMRWQTFMSKDWMVRPDSLIMDDIDVLKSVQNPRIIEDNFRFIEDEVFWWLSNYCQIRVLGNVIKEDWLNPRIREKVKKLPNWVVFHQPIIVNWVPARDRYVLTDKEAEERNKWITDPKAMVISLESKLKELWQTSFNQNMLLIPEKDWEKLIKLKHIKMFDEEIKYDYIEIWIDPAFSEKTKSDKFSITATGFRKVDNVVYKDVLENIALSWDEKSNENVCRQVLNFYLTYKPRKIKIEWNNWWEVFAKMFKNPQLMWWYNLPVDVISSNKDKYTRLKEYEWCFERWEIRFKVWKTEDLIDELLSFTWEPWKPDDRVDSMVFSFYESWKFFYFDIM